ncbi:ThiF family adenylyltransferase [Pseudodesulfovibrio sp.]|uniref:HesA/MoeB/ThiF family protein n=1 Tax=Pseudodesulfovibrio sp. TaxID=2035812 RepID=UPI00261EF438|nr:ThiF family adenylyltransferase [Pseudodesulfovibrio sp.]MDD3310630.1 ThiF family adenylyltransferase [Pseudodesulfovibrio sp.]
MSSLPKAVRARAATAALPDGGMGLILPPTAIRDIARDFGLPGCEVEASALELGIHPERYLRNRRAVSDTDQRLLLRARAAQVGLGGLGGLLLDQFLRLGVGHLRAADGDAFETTNLNRQALATAETLGMSKAEAARLRAAEVNPSVRLEARNEFLTPETLPAFLDGCSLAVDALGGLEIRPALRKAAAEAGIPLVTGALAGWVGYVGVVLPGSVSPSDIMGQRESAEKQLGCPAPAVNLMASLMAAEAVKLLCGRPSSLAGKMLIVDLGALSFDTVTL